MWITAAVAAGTVWGWPAAFALLCLPFGTMWLDWYRAIDNSDQGLLYSLWQVPMLCVPLVAWMGRASRAGSPAGRP